MQVGQECLCKPVTFALSAHGHTQTMSGVIGYIHPAGRYIGVDFRVPGGVIREGFHPMDVRVKNRKR